ncbi:hypothetical protein MMC13_001268 [Lambiella insularis]|nr:hypothetical protein [Lambiella insularis]
MGISLGTALRGLITVAQLSTPPELLSITPGLMFATRSFGGTVGLAIYAAIFNSTLSDNLPTEVAAAAIPLGLKPGNLPTLIAGLTGGDKPSLSRIPNVNPKLLQAAGLAVQSCYVLSFRYVWATARAFSVIALIVAGFLVDRKAEFTYHIDAPIETEAELNRPAITEKIRS